MVHCTWDVLELDAFSSFFKGWRPFFFIHSYWKGQLSFSLSSKHVPSNFDLIIFITSHIFHLPVAVMLTFFHTLQAFNKPQPGRYNIFSYHCALWSCFILGSQLWIYSFQCCLSGTSWDQCVSMVQYYFTSTETVRLVRTDSPGWPPRLSHSSWTMVALFFSKNQLYRKFQLWLWFFVLPCQHNSRI